MDPLGRYMGSHTGCRRCAGPLHLASAGRPERSNVRSPDSTNHIAPPSCAPSWSGGSRHGPTRASSCPERNVDVAPQLARTTPRRPRLRIPIDPSADRSPTYMSWGHRTVRELAGAARGQPGLGRSRVAPGVSLVRATGPGPIDGPKAGPDRRPVQRSLSSRSELTLASMYLMPRPRPRRRRSAFLHGSGMA